MFLQLRLANGDVKKKKKRQAYRFGISSYHYVCGDGKRGERGGGRERAIYQELSEESSRGTSAYWSEFDTFDISRELVV